MNSLIEGLNENNSFTENGCRSYSSTLNANLDFFGAASASRGRDITSYLSKALVEDKQLALKNVMYLRDIREGQGERKQFRDLVKSLVEAFPYEDKDIIALVHKIPEIGRFDDLKVFFGSDYEKLAAELWVSYIKDDNMLAAKWAPVKDSKGAKPLRTVVKMNEASWRKYIVERRSTLEQKMCSKKWEEIEYSKLPSVASSKYTKAFKRNDAERYQDFLEKLHKGETKVNAGALYPYNVVSLLRQDRVLAGSMWKELPDFLDGSEENILPIIDVSGSMVWEFIHGSNSVSCLDVAVGLGIYLSERSKGSFQDYFMTFSQSPELLKTSGSLSNRYQQITRSSWGMSTNLESVFSLILDTAIKKSVPEKDMPSKLLIVSDMQFNCCDYDLHAINMIKQRYESAGYKVPQLVFWQVNARPGATPITYNEVGAALVSGFSPSIMKFVMGDLDPIKVMLDAIDRERYNLDYT
jgi:hypothetical protein